MSSRTRTRASENIRQILHIRYTDEWVGLLVLFSIAAFILAIIEAGFLHQWLAPPAQLHIVLPQTGVANLSAGDEIEVFGIHAGTVRRIRPNANGQLYAVADIDPQVITFIRRDSKAVIKRRFVVAGATYIDISRGYGKPLDWDYAVMSATTGPNPADMLTQTVDAIQERVTPAVERAEHMMVMLDEMITSMHDGKGVVGSLMTRDTLIRQAEQAVHNLNTLVAQLAPLQKQLSSVVGRADVTMGNLQHVSRDVAKASPRMPSIAKHLDQSLENLPATLTQAQAMVIQLQGLIAQLKSMWLLGGSGKVPARHDRLPAQDVQP